jgi:NADH-quinone oxidoreductase subunit C
VISKLNERFTRAIENHVVLADMLTLTVRTDDIYDVLHFLRDHSDLKYNFLTTLCGMHYPESNQLGVVYHLHSFIHNHRIRIKITADLNNPVVRTASSLWPAANWMERETYDFYGILFEGHPNLKRILNVEDMTDFPMRKDFPLEDQTREDKDDTMFGRQ